jgi:UDP-N-acetylglucosamine diphosphorylase/glucosamine-1-phosphate N-acetyltransferase
MRICHFEDARAIDLEPLTLTRPAFELLCGCTRLADKQVRYFSLASSARLERGAIVRPILEDVTREQFPDWHINDANWLTEGNLILVNSRWLPPSPSLQVSPNWSTPCLGMVKDEVAWAILPASSLVGCSLDNVERFLEQGKTQFTVRPAGGVLVRYLWELVDYNCSEIVLDTWLLDPEQRRREDVPLALVGPADRLHIAPDARIDPYVVADTTQGPVVIASGAVITAFTRLEGPCYIGAGTQLLSARIRAGTSIGPCCRVGGEVEASILLGYSNKYHDGFLGHAYIGSWVNLGAGTNNSDLRNDYGEVHVCLHGQRIATGRSKVGCFVGDHTKTGLSTQLNTGTYAGAFCNLLPTGGLLPRVIPSFCGVWNGRLVENTNLEALLATAGRVLHRRGKTLSTAQQELVRRLCEQQENDRRQALRDAELRRLRRIA